MSKMKDLFRNLVVFELANNHQGSIGHGRRIIGLLGEAARKFSIRAGVKLQYRDLDSFIHRDFINRADIKHIPRFLTTRLSPEEFGNLVECIRDNGLIPICTPFDEKSVDLCVEHGIDILKIASCSAIDWPLLEKAAETAKPIIISTGGKTFTDMDNIHSFFKHRGINFAMLHCVGLYPLRNADTQLEVMTRMMKRYHDIHIGYSGHEPAENTDIVKMAIAKGAGILERHVGLEAGDIKLNAYSLDASKIDEWLNAIAAAREICGCAGHKAISESEIQSLNELSRGCYAAQPIQKGEAIPRSAVYFAMPCLPDQISSGQFQDGMTASRDYKKDQGILENKGRTVVNEIRELIHEINGMLGEARITLAPEFRLELSHHYGLEKFKECGVAMIGIINREYCKKILILLPGQRHPAHFHKSKEETFHVLCGDMRIDLEGTVMECKPGDVIVVPRTAWHSFSSRQGCIFEEISTTHIREDSFYDDPNINKLDPMLRKTVLDRW